MTSTHRPTKRRGIDPALPIRTDQTDLEELRNRTVRAPYQMTGPRGVAYRKFCNWIETDPCKPGAVARWSNLSPVQQENWARTAQCNRRAGGRARA